MEYNNQSNLSNIPQFYAGKTIFMTGGTGFMGKVLVERLLFTCPDIRRIHILMRHKRNLKPEERLTCLKQCTLFDVVRNKCPWQLEKFYVVSGDVTLPNLGLSPVSIDLLNEVFVIFHSAASLKFDETLGVVVKQNLIPVIELMDLCNRLLYT